jgi:hypothetical protein
MSVFLYGFWESFNKNVESSFTFHFSYARLHNFLFLNEGNRKYVLCFFCFHAPDANEIVESNNQQVLCHTNRILNQRHFAAVHLMPI